MQSRTWIKLLERMPPEQHDSLMLMTTGGTEVSVQTILRLEEDFMLIRGRLSGTTDSGRIFFIPYDQINYLGISREVKESEVSALLGESPRHAASVQRIIDTPSPTLTRTETMPIAGVAAGQGNPRTIDTPSQTKPTDRLAIPRRSGLIARLRARTNVGDANETPPAT